MKTFFNCLRKAEEIVLVALLVIMCVIIFAATVARFTNFFTITWAEELARYCMIWIIFLGISVAALNGEHFRVEALELFCPPPVLRAISVINAVLVFAFCSFSSYYGVAIIKKQIAGGQLTPSLRWPMWSMYLIIPVGLMLMAICFLYHTYNKLKEKNEEEKS